MTRLPLPVASVLAVLAMGCACAMSPTLEEMLRDYPVCNTAIMQTFFHMLSYMVPLQVPVWSSFTRELDALRVDICDCIVKDWSHDPFIPSNTSNYRRKRNKQTTQKLDALVTRGKAMCKNYSRFYSDFEAKCDVLWRYFLPDEANRPSPGISTSVMAVNGPMFHAGGQRRGSPVRSFLFALLRTREQQLLVDEDIIEDEDSYLSDMLTAVANHESMLVTLWSVHSRRYGLWHFHKATYEYLCEQFEIDDVVKPSLEQPKFDEALLRTPEDIFSTVLEYVNVGAMGVTSLMLGLRLFFSY